MKTKIFFPLLGILLVTTIAFAEMPSGEDPAPLPVPDTQQTVETRSFESAALSVQQQLEDSLKELSALRDEIAQKKIPLNRELSALEDELSKVRNEYQQTLRLLDSRTLDLTNLKGEIKSRNEEASYISNLLTEYIRNFESRIHIAEVKRYAEVLEKAKLAPENSNLTQTEVYEDQINVILASIVRLTDALGGEKFEGTAVTETGVVKPGTFVLVGPSAIFMSKDGNDIGTAEQRLGSLEPAVIPFASEEQKLAAQKVIKDAEGFFPLDPSLGNAHKIEATKETLWEHILKGGAVMWPILLLAGAAFLVALYKWITLSMLKTPSPKQLQVFLNAVANQGQRAAAQAADKIGGPVGQMLSAGVAHLNDPRELIEEVMFEIVMATRLKLQNLLPFVAVSASSAPLLGLLGTVTGIINTFKLITVFGSGDVKTLSGGISEALITTEYGLIVAIPSLLLHAFLSRKAKGIIDQMDGAAVAFINQISKKAVMVNTPKIEDVELKIKN